AAPAPVGVGEVRRRAVVVAAAVGPAQEPPERPGRAPAAVGAPRGILAVPAADGRSAGKAARRHPSPGGRMHDYERSLETTEPGNRGKKRRMVATDGDRWTQMKKDVKETKRVQPGPIPVLSVS